MGAVVSAHDADRLKLVANKVPPATESYLEDDFVMNLLKTVLLGLYPAADRLAALPFANLEWRTGGRKHIRSHGLTGQAV